MISEAFIHMSGQAQAILFILLGNVMHWDPDREMMDTQVCMVRKMVTAKLYYRLYRISLWHSTVKVQ